MLQCIIGPEKKQAKKLFEITVLRKNDFPFRLNTRESIENILEYFWSCS